MAIATAAMVIVALWLYLAWRTVAVAFTADEGVSYGIIHGVPTFVQSANNQWLNTLLMRVSQSIFGASDWALRLPNLLAFGVYAASALWLIAELRSTPARILAFVILVTDPFLLEFFGLARGYGLSVGFAAGAVASYYAARRRVPAWSCGWGFAAAGAMASLSFYANFAALNFSLALLGVAAIDVLLLARRGGRHNWQLAGLQAGLLAATAASLIPGVHHVQYLQHVGQLYYGGHNGFVSDTLGSLAETWAYVYRYPPTLPGVWGVVAWLILAVIVVGVAWAAFRVVRFREWGNAQRAALMLALAIAAAQVEAWVLGTLYPIDRVALTYVVLFGFFCGFWVDDIEFRQNAAAIAVGTVAAAALLLGLANVVRTANLTRTLIWGFDASSRDVVNAVVKLEQREGVPTHPWTLVTGFPQDSAIEYYRQLRGLYWLQPIGREPVSTPGGDLYLVTDDERGQLPKGTVLLARFPKTSAELREGPALASDP